MGWFLFGLAVVVLALAFYSGVRFGARLPAAKPERAVLPVQRATGSRLAPEKDLSWIETAVYIFIGRYRGKRDVVLYVGIAANPTKRAEQHAESKEWWGDVERVEAWWVYDRYIALAIEWALIKYLNPVHNVAPGAADDAYCGEDRPDFRPAHVRLPSRTGARVRSTARRAIQRGGGSDAES